MFSNCSKFSEIICQKIFKIINILIDLMFGIFHYFVKHENWYIRYANIIKFISTAIFNTLDIFQVHCSCCSNKNSEKDKLNDDKINKELDKRIANLELEKEILIRLRDEPEKTSDKYLEMIKKHDIIQN